MAHISIPHHTALVCCLVPEMEKNKLMKDRRRWIWFNVWYLHSCKRWNVRICRFNWNKFYHCYSVRLWRKNEAKQSELRNQNKNVDKILPLALPFVLLLYLIRFDNPNTNKKKAIFASTEFNIYWISYFAGSKISWSGKKSIDLFFAFVLLAEQHLLLFRHSIGSKEIFLSLYSLPFYRKCVVIINKLNR